MSAKIARISPKVIPFNERISKFKYFFLFVQKLLSIHLQTHIINLISLEKKSLESRAAACSPIFSLVHSTKTKSKLRNCLPCHWQKTIHRRLWSYILLLIFCACCCCVRHLLEQVVGFIQLHRHTNNTIA